MAAFVFRISKNFLADEQDEANDSEMSALDCKRQQTNNGGCEVCFPAAQQTRAFGSADGGVGRALD